MTTGEKTWFGEIPARLRLVLGLWVLLNALQAALTELNPDEAYYWLYSRDLAWGYFDHPPMIAFMIRVGTGLFSGELGVRLLTVLLSGADLLLLWVLAGRPQAGRRLDLLLVLFVAMPFFHVYGFVATPDSPLLFFALLYYVLFERVLASDAWKIWLALGACMAAMLYSKYHGVLVIGFSILSQPRLLRNPRLYVSALWGAVLFSPHLLWQLEEGFPSFRYHLLERNNPMQPKHLIAYLTNQLVIFNPFVFPLLFAAFYRAAGQVFRSGLGGMQRTWVVTTIGFWLFFLATVYRGHVEPHWTAVLSIPLMILGYRESFHREGFGFWLRRLALVSLLPLLVIRTVILKGVLETTVPLFHERQWVHALHAQLGDGPVLFNNILQLPSMYQFYARQPAYAMYTLGGRRATQFDLWPWQEKVQGKPVAIAQDTIYGCRGCTQVQAADRQLEVKRLASFPVMAKLEMGLKVDTAYWTPGSRHTIPYVLQNPYPDTAVVLDPGQSVRPVAVFRKPRQEGLLPIEALAERLPPGTPLSQRSALDHWLYVPIQIQVGAIPPGGVVRGEFEFRVPPDWYGTGLFGLSLQWDGLDPFVPSRFVPVRMPTDPLSSKD